MFIGKQVVSYSSKSSFAAAVLIFLALATADLVTAQSSRAGTGEVIAIRELTLKAGVDPADFERFVVERFNPAWEGAVPGLKAYIARADRGTRRGGYALFCVFDSEKTRHAIVPADGSGVSEAFRPLLERLFAGPYQELVSRYLQAEPAFTDYVVLR